MSVPCIVKIKIFLEGIATDALSMVPTLLMIGFHKMGIQGMMKRFLDVATPWFSEPFFWRIVVYGGHQPFPAY